MPRKVTVKIKLPESLLYQLMILSAGGRNKEVIETYAELMQEETINGLLMTDLLSLESTGMFLAHLSHESEGFTDLKEDTNYTPERAYHIWPKYFDDIDHAIAIMTEGGEQALFNTVYGGRMGNDLDGDGWRFIGRGLSNVTGEWNYEETGDAVGEDYVNNPELLEEPRHAYLSSFAMLFIDNELLDAIKDVDLVESTRQLNGGLNGLDHRRMLWGEIKHALDGEVELSDEINYGSKCFGVRIIQYYLSKYNEDIVIDGHWGSATQHLIESHICDRKLTFRPLEVEALLYRLEKDL